MRRRIARDDHAMDVMLGDDAPELVGRAQHPRGRRPRRRVEGIHPTNVAFTLGLASELGPEPVGDGGVADEQAALGRGGLAGDGAGGHTAGDLQDRQPEPGDRHEVRRHRRSQQRALEQESDHRGERRGVEDGGRLVEGALAQEQLVTPVQPQRAVDENDHRQGANAVAPGPVAAKIRSARPTTRGPRHSAVNGAPRKTRSRRRRPHASGSRPAWQARCRNRSRATSRLAALGTGSTLTLNTR